QRVHPYLAAVAPSGPRLPARDARRVVGAPQPFPICPSCPAPCSGGLPLHGDLDGAARAVARHAVQRVAVAAERDPLTRRALQGDGAAVCDDDAGITGLPPRHISSSPSGLHQLIRPVILDLERHGAIRGIAAATVSAADRPAPSSPGPDELARNAGTRRVRLREPRNRLVGPLRGTAGVEDDQGGGDEERDNLALEHWRVPPILEAPS